MSAEHSTPESAGDSAASADDTLFDTDKVRADLEALHNRAPGSQMATNQRIGSALREIIERITGTSHPTHALDDIAERLEKVASDLKVDQGEPRLYEGFAETAVADRPAAFFHWSPMMGTANPLAPPMVPSAEEDKVVCHGTFGSAYEGPPGCIHGGYIAAAFDDVLGLAQIFTGRRAMTGTLEIKYRRPTPLHRKLRFEAAAEKADGRKVVVKGRCYVAGSDGEADQLTAEASAIFVRVPIERFGKLIATREHGDD